MKRKIYFMLLLGLFMFLPSAIYAANYTVVSGDLDTVGSVVKIGDEEFYVIGKEDSNHIKLFAKYNLDVGSGITDPTYKQNENAIASKFFMPNIGFLTFGDSVNYNDSDIKAYVDNYVDYLIKNEHVSVSGRLLDLMEFESLVNDGNSLPLGYIPDQSSTYMDNEWIFDVSFWLETSSSNKVYGVDGYGKLLDCKEPNDPRAYFGARPVIILNTLERNVTFNTDGGSSITSQVVPDGLSIPEPKTPVKEGYTFYGWFSDPEMENSFNFDNSITSDTIIYAKFVKNSNVIKNVNIWFTLPEIGSNITKIPDSSGYKPNIVPTFVSDLPKELFTEIALAYEDLSDFYTGTIEKDETYFVFFYAFANKDYAFAPDATITFNGTKKVSMVSTTNDNILILTGIKANKQYKILDGDKQDFNTNDTKDLVVRADGELSKLTGIKVDNVLIEKDKDYTLENGSTILTLAPDYLKTLASGIHFITFIYNDGEAYASFNNVSVPVNNTNITETTNSTDVANNPKTKDNIVVYVSILGLSIISITLTALYLKKRSFK